MTTATFADLGLSPDLLEAIEKAGYLSPTPVQIQTVPAMLAGGDVVIQSQTGTGKTAAFVLPILEQLQPRPGVVEALVLSPTRELAQQIANEVLRLGASRSIIPAAIYGGTSFQKQYDALETAQFVIATPGRLLDLLRRGKISLAKVRFFGLDEADELLSMGFEKDVTDVISRLPGKTASFICSATFSETIRRVADTFIADPTLVNCSSDRIGAKSVKHVLVDTESGARAEVLRRLIAAESIAGAVVFCNTKSATFRIFEELKREGLRADLLNGDLSQAEREKALERMRAGEVDFLVATDVAARGIDISGLPAVINFDMPETPEVYVHRTGRTGRAGQAGVAYSLLTPGDITVLHALEKFFRLVFVRQPSPPRALLMTRRADQLLTQALDGLDADGSLSYAQWIPVARRLMEHGDAHRLIAKLVAHFDQSRHAARPVSQDVTIASDAGEPAEDATAPPQPTERDGSDPANDEAFDAVMEGDSGDVGEASERQPEARRGRRRRPRRGGSADAPAASHAPADAGAPTDAVRPGKSATQPKPLERRAAATAEEPAAHAPAAGDAANDDAANENAVLQFFLTTTNKRNEGRFVGTRRIGEVTGLDEASIFALAAQATEFIETSRNGEMWRLRKGVKSAETASGAARPDAPPRERATTPQETEATPATAAKAPRTPSTKTTPAKAGSSRSGSSRAEDATPPAAGQNGSPASKERSRDRRSSASSSRNGRSRAPIRRIFDDPEVVTPEGGTVAPTRYTLPDPADLGFGTLRINVGPKDVSDAETLADAIAEMSGFDRRDDFGTVRFEKDHALLEVRRDYLQDVQQAISKQQFGAISLNARVHSRGGKA